MISPSNQLRHEPPATRKCGVPRIGSDTLCSVDTDILLKVQGVDYWDDFGEMLPVCQDHAETALAAALVLFPSATLWQHCEKQVTRYGYQEYHPPAPESVIKSKRERTGCFHPFPCGCPDRAES